jgi:predicted esterase
MATTHTIQAATHGRYLVEAPPRERAAGLLVGCHGYGEGASAQLDRMRSIPGASAWRLVSIQGLHRFYNRRSQEVVASWMTREDRELAIADNIRFVNAVIHAVAAGPSAGEPLVFTGFSQGVAMAFRAACGSSRAVAGIIAVGGDVPPELDRTALARLPRALVVRGRSDEWYTHEKWTRDRERLLEASVNVRPVEFDGGHEWTATVSGHAAAFLDYCTRST